MMKRGMILSFFKGLAYFLFFRLGSLLLCLPAWLLLVFHFTFDISIWWFIGYIIAWFVLGVLRFALIIFARYGARDEQALQNAQKNKNPYSKHNNAV